MALIEKWSEERKSLIEIIKNEETKAEFWRRSLVGGVTVRKRKE